MGAMTSKSNSAEIFVQCTYAMFHHPMFTRSEVIVLTNKQTDRQTPLKTSNALRYATTLGNKYRRQIYTESFQRQWRSRISSCDDI